jgi:hypothetical protein
MKGENEHKKNIVQRLINSSAKLQQKKEVQSKSSVHKFQYQLPKSFFDAVDDARVEAGYDVLPRFHHLSLSPSPDRQTPPSSSSSRRSNKQQQEKHRHHSHRQNETKHVHSSSRSDNDNGSPKKVRIRRSNRKRPHDHHT